MMYVSVPSLNPMACAGDLPNNRDGPVTSPPSPLTNTDIHAQTETHTHTHTNSQAHTLTHSLNQSITHARTVSRDPVGAFHGNGHAVDLLGGHGAHDAHDVNMYGN